MASGASLATVAEEVRAVGDRLAATSPRRGSDPGLWSERMGENWREHLRARGLILLIAASVLLLVAATNTAALLLTRSVGRRREMVVRTALGAGRARLVRQVGLETLALTTIGTLAGSVLAPSILRAFLRLAPEEIPAYVAIQGDLRAGAFVVVTLIVTSLLAGTIPALAGTRVRAGEVVGPRATAGPRERSLGEALIVAEVALTVALVAGSGLLLRSYQAMGRADLGYRTDSLLGMALFVDSADVDRDAELIGLYDRIRSQLTTHAGVRALGLVSPTAPPGRGGETELRWDGMTPGLQDRGLTVWRHAVDPHFLLAVGIPVIEGRGVEAGDARSEVPVVVVSASVAALLGGTDMVVGREVEVAGTRHRVVGVARDVMYHGPVLRRARDLDVYTSLERSPSRLVSIAVVGRAEPEALIGPLTEHLHQIAPTSAVDWVDPTTAAIDGHFQGPRFYLLLVVVFAGGSLGLTAVGLFATLAHMVAKRGSEIGIRGALGAEPRGLVAHVVGRALVVAGIGFGFGLIGAGLAGRLLGGMLYGVGAVDPVTLGATAAVIATVAMLAAVVPALRAARVSPVSALKGG